MKILHLGLYLVGFVFAGAAGTAINSASAAESATITIPNISSEVISFNSIKNGWGILLRAPKKHHFNIQAPMSASVIPKTAPSEKIEFKIDQKSEKSILFSGISEKINSSPQGIDTASVSIYLCDDAKTFCIKKDMSVKLRAPTEEAAESNPNVETNASDITLSPGPGRSVKIKKNKKESAPAPEPAPVAATVVQPPVQEPVAAPALKDLAQELKKSDQALPEKRSIAKKDERGFWMNAPEEAFKEAAETKKPLMIDFFGIWCPPCNMFDEMVFNRSDFKKMSKNFVLLKLDSDLPVAWRLKSKYKITGYPTLIFAKPDDGQEISRVVGYLGLDDLLKRMMVAYGNRAHTFQEQVEMLRGKPGHLASLVSWINNLIDQKEFKLAREKIAEAYTVAKLDDEVAAVGLLETVAEFNEFEADFNSSPVKLIKFLENKKIQSIIKKATELKKQVSSPVLIVGDFFIISVLSVFQENESGINPKSKEELVPFLKNAGLEWVNELYTRVNPKTLFIDDLEASRADLDSIKMDLAETTGDEAALKEARLAGVKSYQELIKINNKKDSRGLNLELAYLLRKTGKTEEAKKLYKKFIKKYPEEFTFYFAAAKFYQELKELKLAREMAENAVKYAYGDNKIRCVDTLAKIRVAQGEVQGAVQLIDDFEKTVQLPAPELKLRTNRYLKQLTDTKAKLIEQLKAKQ